MQIAMISEHASPLAVLGEADAGGQNVHVAALARSLAADGHRIDVYTRRDDPDLPERVPLAPGVDVVHVDAGPAEPLPKDDLLPWMEPFGDDLAARFTDPATRPDVLHAHFWMSGLAALRATREGARTGTPRVPVVQTFHALGSVKRRYQGAADTSPAERTGLESTLCREADLVLATCRDEIRELHRIGATDDRIRMVPCGVDLRTFTPGPVPVRPDDDPLRVLSLGRLVTRKGVATVVEALARLAERGHQPVELLVAGGPPVDQLDRDAEVRRLRGIARDAGVAEHVRFLGAVPHDDVPGLIRSVDVVACTPWYEPFGIVPLEAGACGRPVVASAVGGMLDTVAHDRTGILVPPRDPAAVAAALGRLADRRFRRRLGTAARVRAERRYGWAEIARQTSGAYTAVAGPPAARHHATAHPAVAHTSLATAAGGTR
ncbi:glycosyltransferase [Myceligenerans pegani]|uniref:Glycosyltransferase n=1 Tax=Myceligenerans pegani TaxID=2776917 RepID=A0ABR9MYV5_9MICO|nr:glycosyltransferase [Myceligenerans sp. TRM 65318]MBE1876559.1 glycosyltransferase [Myceligenerans sp. TRM 65318]MBE3018830.1 glycosyltransferase [Myceligenerans sp. TRM 65318]